MADQKRPVGFIGVGLMGHGMAKNILKAGYPLTIMGHRNRVPVEDLVALGAKEAKSPAEVARASEVIFLCVTSSAEVEQIVTGPDGIMAASRKGQIIADTTTADPNSTLKLAGLLEAKGVRIVDAALGRGPREAEEGRLNTFIGADEATLQEIMPLIKTWAENIVHVGPVGSGHKVKLINQLVAMGYNAIWAEAYTACRKTGIEPKKFYDVIKAGGMYCGNFENNSKWVLGRDPKAHAFALSNCLKDMRYYNHMVDAAGMTSIVGEAVQQDYAVAMALGAGGRYMPMLADVLSEFNGATIESAGTGSPAGAGRRR